MRKFISILAIIALLGVMLFMLTGCGTKEDTNTPNNGGTTTNSGNNTAGESFEYGQNYIDNHLKGDYWIAYNLTTYENGESDSSTIEIKKTDAGYYFSQNGSEGLFIKNGDKYDMYNGSDGEYTKSEYMQYDKDYVELMMNAYTMYMTSYVGYANALSKSGTDTIAGRDCDVYKMDYNHPMYNYQYKYTYYIDKDTGVGLKFSMDLSGSGQKMGVEFEATKFQTSGVSLPNY